MKYCCCCYLVDNCVRFFVTPWTTAHRAPLSIDLPGKNTGVGCHFPLQGLFLTQGSNSHLVLGRQILYHWATRKWKWKSLSHVWFFATPWTIKSILLDSNSPILLARILEWVAFPFSRGSSPPRDRTQASHTAGGFFISWATREAWAPRGTHNGILLRKNK